MCSGGDPSHYKSSACCQAACITPNETEGKQLFTDTSASVREQLHSKLVVTKGRSGVSYQDKLIPAYTVEVLDTTGAGDAFNGALTVALAEGQDVSEVIQFAMERLHSLFKRLVHRKECQCEKNWTLF
ncbi:PfkB family carbohydrate kinase [Virgibacillus ihumii]|uniref:PfkB family carbohydrate kinase n=1 Tax=Virgibacillus ihumii TaxID=2686091 RepID=UPI0031B63E7E